MRVFISWSGRDSVSWEMARVLHEVLGVFMDGIDPWMSDKDILAGASWRAELLDALKETAFCVVCLDQQSVRSLWIAFEVGFISNTLAEAHICPFLVGLSPEEIERTPFSKYQAKRALKEETWDLFLAIGRRQQGEENPKYEQRLRSRFELFWENQLSKEFERLRNKARTRGSDAVARRGRQGPRNEAEARTQQPTPEPETPLTEPESPHAEPEVRGLFVPSTEMEGGAGQKQPFRLWLFNTLYYPRKGYVMHDWEPIFKATGIPPQEVVVRDAKGQELPAQVDHFEYPGPTQTTLIFSLLDDIPPVPEDYSTPSSHVTIERGSARQWPNQPQWKLDEQWGQRRLKLINSRLELWMELKPKPWDDKDKEWYAGAATAVLLDGREILDTFNWELGLSDIEKRCMQLDRLHLLYPGGERVQHNHFDLIRNWYDVISKSSGPVRSVVTIASPRLSYSHTGQLDQRAQGAGCRLYRTLSLYRGENYITEELKVYGTHGFGQVGNGVVPLDFDTRYFSYMDMGLDPSIKMTGANPKWFTISTKWAPYQGYGFATQADLQPVANPDPDFISAENNEHKTFIWEMRRCVEPTCVHLFTRDTPKDLESAVRRAWHEIIDRPISASIKL